MVLRRDGNEEEEESSLSSATTASPSSTLSVQNETSDRQDPEQAGRLPPQEKERSPDGKDPNIVGWEPDEKANPRNWTTRYKIFITFELGLLALCASLGSSIISPTNRTIAQYVGVSEEVSTFSVSLYILGFAFGPLLWAPISEVWGRRISMLPAVFCLGIFSIGTAVSRNAASIFITRFFAGVFGSAPVSNVTAALGDFWSPNARGWAVTFYAIMVVGGPTIGPIIGSAILVNPHLGWRWTEYIEAILVFAILIFSFFFLPELYGPVLLKAKAQRLRTETGNTELYHPHERIKLDVHSIVTKQLSRPILMLTTEPMVTCIAIYASFVYSLLYTTLEFFPIIYQEHRHYSPVVSTLPFLGLFIGVLCAVGLNLGNQPRYARISKQAGGKPVPEARLPPVAIGGVIFAIGLFWFGWTATPATIPWPASVCAAIFIGAGFNSIFQQCINFLVDTYGLYAASAVSANTFLRSVLAAGLPLAARPMFDALGVGPAMSLLGGVACLAIPVPFAFMRWGKDLRRMSRFVQLDDDDDRNDPPPPQKKEQV